MDNKGKDKRRRIDKESDEPRNKKVRQRDQEEATEEQVEEFFAILRRMQVAVKYFDKGNGESWRAAVEAEVVAVVGDGCGGEEEEDDQRKIKQGAPETSKPILEEETAVLDLNALPEVENDEI